MPATEWLDDTARLMAESRRDQKTEQPTHKRRREFRRYGRVAKSADLGAVASLITALVMFRLLGGSMIQSFRSGLVDIFSTAGGGLSESALADVVPGVFVVALAPVLAAFVVVGLGSNVAQTGVIFAPKLVKPKLSRVSPR
ncbi:MAG: flagellar biosynthetic protein FlhB [Candidatus Poriferisodalaceae bacterium]|jgi:flagellar biosynthetic protein FlhB